MAFEALDCLNIAVSLANSNPQALQALSFGFMYHDVEIIMPLSLWTGYAASQNLCVARNTEDFECEDLGDQKGHCLKIGGCGGEEEFRLEILLSRWFYMANLN
ncbi:uncharacterized protein J3R85_020663 [Psidium guajava]|nr:uncharacterized protein J3R85_020663 [Psidium guajava]